MVLYAWLFCGWYGGSFGRPCLSSAHEERMAEAITKIRALYDAGIPFYTKESLRDACQQLEKRAERGQKISITGLNGATVDFEIETGRTHGPADSDSEFILREPLIFYFGFQHLTSTVHNDAPHFAYCNIRIFHCMERRNKLTKEIVDAPFIHSDEEVEAFFQSVRAMWDVSDTCKQLKSILLLTETQFKVSKVVGFACASMAYNHQEDGETHRAAFQHALLLTLQDEFSKKQNNSHHIRCYAQDPAYTPIDELVLERHKITVLNDPKGFLEVDDSTVVSSCAPNVPVKEIILDLALPAMMIWNRISEDDLEYIRTDPNSPRVRELARNCYKQLAFPGDEEHFGNVAIYVRQTTLPSP